MMREKHSVQWIGLRENLSRKPWFLALHNGVSCRSSLNPYWNMLISFLVAILIIIWFRHQEVYLNEEFSVFFGGRPMLKHLHLLSEQWLLNPCWLMISSGIILPNLWGIIDDYRGLYDPIYDNIWIYIYTYIYGYIWGIIIIQ